MMDTRQYCVYIMTNFKNTVLYTGITNDLVRRVGEHKSGAGGGFSSKYHLTRLVYYECGSDVEWAILREKQLKAGSRKRKLDLINKVNPEWKDLSEDF